MQRKYIGHARQTAAFSFLGVLKKLKNICKEPDSEKTLMRIKKDETMWYKNHNYS